MPKKSRRLVWLVLLLVAAYFLRPVLHPFLMPFVISPLKAVLIIAILFALGSVTATFRALKTKQIGPGNYTLYAPNGFPWHKFSVSLVAILIILFGLMLENSIRFYMTSRQVDYTVKADLPEFDPLRLTPKQVARRYAEDTFQNPQEHLGDSQIINQDGKIVRIFPRLPDGNILYFLNKMSGFVTVDVDTLERKVEIANAEFKYSEQVGIFDNLYYRLHLKKYFVTYSSEPVYLKDEGGAWVTAVPYMKYRGFPFTVPYWAGVMIVQADGTMTDYTPEEAAALAYMKNARLHPKEIVDFYTHSYSYKGGLINKWFLHKNQIEVVNLPSDERLIHVSTNEGFKQMVVAEPYGRSYGIYKIFLFDATTGKREVVEYDQTSQLTGPVAAADYIRKTFPTYSWDSFSLSEPRPLKINGELNWMLSIIPNDYAGIAKTVIFNAKTNKVVGFDTEAELDKYRNTGVVEVEPTTTPTIPTNADALKQKIETIEKELGELKNLIAN